MGARAAAAVAVLVVAGCSSGGSGAPLGANITPTSTAISASYPRGDFRTAVLAVPAGATSIQVGFGTPNDSLVTATTAVGSGVTPVIKAADVTDGTAATSAHLSIDLASTATNAQAKSTDRLTLRLNPDVVWSLALTGGASSEVIDATGGRATQIQLGHASSAVVRLAKRSGVTTIDEVGGVSALRISAPRAEVASVTADAGAGSITIDGVTHTGVATGTTIAPSGYANAASRLDVQLEGGASSVTIAPH